MTTSLRPASVDPVPIGLLARVAGVRPPPGARRRPVLVTGVTLDSRTVCPGDLYAALPGANVHGARFTAGAVRAGAVAILTDQVGASTAALSELTVPVLVAPDPRAVLGELAATVYGRPADALTMLGVTGTNGKTTTAYLVDSALRALGRITGLVGTVETRVADRRMRSVRTTPEAPDLQALLAVMRERSVDTVTMEVSSHALSLHRVDGVRYDVAAFTNLSQDHLDFHHSMDDYFAAKASLFSPKRAKAGVVCVDDPWGRRLADAADVPVSTVGGENAGAPDWTVVPDARGGPGFQLVGADTRLRLRSALPGDFNRTNTAVAAVVLMTLGIAADQVEQALAADPRVPGRMERVRLDGVEHTQAVVDFAHTPEAVAAALSSLRSGTGGRLVVVLGAGGDRDTAKRAAMGAAAARHADEVVVTDDNPRSEDPAAIRAAILAGAVAELGPSSGRLHEVAGRSAAIRYAVSLARTPQDTVVVLGKGHETGQEVAGTVHPFDDRAELRAALVAEVAP